MTRGSRGARRGQSLPQRWARIREAIKLEARLFRRLFAYTRPYRGRLFASWVATLGYAAAVPGAESADGYFVAKAAEGKSPKIGWEWMVVVGVFAGAALSARLSGDRSPGTVPALWRWRFGDSTAVRLAAAFLAGSVMLFGARLAGGCTSGHGISGNLQLAASSLVFSAAFVAAATATAFAVYGREGADHV